MRYSCLLAIVLLCSLLQPVSALPIDSLRAALPLAKTRSEQIRIYRDLADATAETSQSCGYLRQLVEQAKAEQQTHSLMEALTDLTITYIQLDKPDSAHYYASKAKEQLSGDLCDQWCCYLKMRLFASDIQGAEAEQAVEEKIAEFRTRSIAQENSYQKIEAEFCVAMALESKGAQEEAITHLRNALELSEAVAFRERVPYQLLILHQLARIHNSIRKTQLASEFTNRAIGIREKYYEDYEKKVRPALSLDGFYITNYTSLLINIEHMSDEAIDYYLSRLIELSDRSKNPSHRYNRFHAQFNYSVIKKDIAQALVYNDSLIHYARQIATYNLPGLYRINAHIFEAMGQNKQALDNLQMSHNIRDSIRQSQMRGQVDQMRVEYDVNQLNHEKSQLQIRNKHIQLITLSIALLVIGIICIQLYRHLERERERKKHIQRLKLRAEESEKLKTSFINSMCQEIRTPLNGISTSTNLLLDPTLPNEERMQQPEQILHNTTLLLSLIDSMVEVSSLNVSEEKLPCKPVDVVELCRKAFDRRSQGNNVGVVNLAQLPNKPLVITTNDRYLLLVIDNLLSNAYKFTRRGSVSLCCERRDTSVVISVTDTGRGIPVDKHQEVFGRFSKLDPNMQGHGLGLYLCRLIVGKLSGEIHIDPEYTKGTRIIVTLPRTL